MPPERGAAITIKTGSFLGYNIGHWAAIADTAFGRYFLVLAWAALYFALAKAEEARAAERREGNTDALRRRRSCGPCVIR
ncbi:hypothetical protein ACFSHP_03610 [Novosphingobium panipatense]